MYTSQNDEDCSSAAIIKNYGRELWDTLYNVLLRRSIFAASFILNKQRRGLFFIGSCTVTFKTFFMLNKPDISTQLGIVEKQREKRRKVRYEEFRCAERINDSGARALNEGAKIAKDTAGGIARTIERRPTGSV